MEVAQRGWKEGAGSIYRVGEKLILFRKEEQEAYERLELLISGYLAGQTPPRPLCIALFGAPGSGKSFGVKQLLGKLSKERPRPFPTLELNLTQMPSPVALADTLQGWLSPWTIPPAIFFDEFDAPLGGAPWGWLSWFLSPMQDGSFRAGAREVPLSRALFFFAGGTASRLADFGASDPAGFARAKGPDFVSRLRGVLDVSGPDREPHRDLRRATLIHHASVEAARVRPVETASKLNLHEDLVKALLDVGRFRHGARSIAAIVEMASATAARLQKDPVSIEHLPDDATLGVHVDRGPLDPLRIGGLVGMSGTGGGQTRVAATPDGKPSSTEAETPASPADDVQLLWTDLAEALWKEGASIAFGGGHKPEDFVTGLTDLVALPKRLSRDTATHGQDPRLVLFPRESLVSQVSSEARPFVQVVQSPATVAPCLPSPRADRAFRDFAHRWCMTCRCAARVAMSGKLEGYSGRMPGVLEEVMLALSLMQPVYLVGGFGGAARVIGVLLGLGSEGARAGKADWDRDNAWAPELQPHASRFQPGHTPLPLTGDDAAGWLIGRAVGGPLWPDNGLSVEENRLLFETKRTGDVVDLVCRGLLNRFGR